MQVCQGLLEQFQGLGSLAGLLLVALFVFLYLFKLFQPLPAVVHGSQELPGLFGTGAGFNAAPAFLCCVEPGFVKLGVFTAGLVLRLGDQGLDTLLHGGFGGLLVFHGLQALLDCLVDTLVPALGLLEHLLQELFLLKAVGGFQANGGGYAVNGKLGEFGLWRIVSELVFLGFPQKLSFGPGFLLAGLGRFWRAVFRSACRGCLAGFKQFLNECSHIKVSFGIETSLRWRQSVLPPATGTVGCAGRCVKSAGSLAFCKPSRKGAVWQKEMKIPKTRITRPARWRCACWLGVNTVARSWR